MGRCGLVDWRPAMMGSGCPSRLPSGTVSFTEGPTEVPVDTQRARTHAYGGTGSGTALPKSAPSLLSSSEGCMASRS